MGLRGNHGPISHPVPVHPIHPSWFRSCSSHPFWHCSCSIASCNHTILFQFLWSCYSSPDRPVHLIRLYSCPDSSQSSSSVTKLSWYVPVLLLRHEVALIRPAIFQVRPSHPNPSFILIRLSSPDPPQSSLSVLHSSWFEVAWRETLIANEELFDKCLTSL